MTTVIQNAPWDAALKALTNFPMAEISTSRASWAPGRSVMRGPNGLGLVIGIHGHAWEPHSVDERATDWLIVLPAAEA